MTATLLALALTASPQPGGAGGAEALTGTWFFEDFRRSGRATDTELMIVWDSPVAVTAGGFVVQRFLGGPKSYEGQLRFDPAKLTHVDLVLAEFDLTPLGAPLKIAAGARPGVWKLEGDTLKLAFHRLPGGARPTGVDQLGNDIMRAALKRAPAGVAALPKLVEVTVTGPDKKPVAGVQLTSYVTFTPPAKSLSVTGPDGKPKATQVYQPDPGFAEPQLQVLATTDAAGRAKVSPADFPGATLIAYDPKTKSIAYQPVTPAGLASGPVAVTLVPSREVVLKVTCPELPDGLARVAFPAGKPSDPALPTLEALNNVNSYLHAGGRRAAFAASGLGGTLRYFAPPGDYTVEVYSKQIVPQTLTLTVPPGEGALAVPVVVKSSAGARLVGKPAPEFEGVHAALNGSVKLGDYRGKYVVLDFWGYWCGPCIETMPTWIAVHDKYSGERVAVVTVHQDGGGEVTNAEQYDAKIKSIKAKLWKGRDLPFPVALVSAKDGEHGLAAKQYGVQSWPTTFLIGPDGKVIGVFDHRDAESAIAALDAILKTPAKGSP